MAGLTSLIHIYMEQLAIAIVVLPHILTLLGAHYPSLSPSAPSLQHCQLAAPAKVLQDQPPVQHSLPITR